MLTFMFICWAVAVLLTWHIAKSNGRNDGLAVLLGILFGWFAVIGYLIAGKTFDKKLAEADALRRARGVDDRV